MSFAEIVHSLGRLQRELDEALAKKKKADESQQLRLSRTEGGGFQRKVEGPRCGCCFSPLRLQSELESALASKHKADENEQLQLGRRHEMNTADSACFFMSCVSVLPPLRLHSELQSAIASKQKAEDQQLDSATSRCHYRAAICAPPFLFQASVRAGCSHCQQAGSRCRSTAVAQTHQRAVAHCMTHAPWLLLHVGLLPFTGCRAS